MIYRKSVGIALATAIGTAWLAVPVLADHASDHRGEIEKQHEKMVGSEEGSHAPAPDAARAVEMSHEEMQSTDHEGHVEAPPTGRTTAEQ